MKLRVKSYKDNAIHDRLDLTLQDVDDITRVLGYVEDFLINEFNDIQEEGEEDDSSIDEQDSLPLDLWEDRRKTKKSVRHD